MTPEFHRPFALERLARHGVDETVEADAAECAALALRLAVPAVLALTCRFHLTPVADRSVLAEGRLSARVLRNCVVTLDDFETPIEESFRVRFVPAVQELDDEALDPESDDEIPFEGASIDLGEAAAEQLALVLDPYPRKPGAVLPEEAGDAESSPFAALARFRRPE